MTPIGWVFFGGFWVSVALNIVLLIWIVKVIAELDDAREGIRVYGRAYTENVVERAHKDHDD